MPALVQVGNLFIRSLHDSTFSRTVWRLYGGAKGLVVWYYGNPFTSVVGFLLPVFMHYRVCRCRRIVAYWLGGMVGGDARPSESVEGDARPRKVPYYMCSLIQLAPHQTSI